MTAAEFAKLADAAGEFEEHPTDRPSRQLSHRVYAERQRIHRALLVLEECESQSIAEPYASILRRAEEAQRVG